MAPTGPWLHFGTQIMPRSRLQGAAQAGPGRLQLSQRPLREHRAPPFVEALGAARRVLRTAHGEEEGDGVLDLKSIDLHQRYHLQPTIPCRSSFCVDIVIIILITYNL